MKEIIAKNRNAEIKVVVEEGEWFYIHPLTGTNCRDISQILSGWSVEGEMEDWVTLVRVLQNDPLLQEWIEQADEGDTVVVEYRDGKGDYRYE